MERKCNKAVRERGKREGNNRCICSRGSCGQLLTLRHPCAESTTQPASLRITVLGPQLARLPPLSCLLLTAIQQVYPRALGVSGTGFPVQGCVPDSNHAARQTMSLAGLAALCSCGYVFCSVWATEDIYQRGEIEVNDCVLCFQPATATLWGVCRSRPVMWTQASACAGPLPPAHAVRSALYVFAYNFPYRSGYRFLSHCQGETWSCSLLSLSYCVSVFTLHKAANTRSRPPPSRRELVVKHSPAGQHLPDRAEQTQAPCQYFVVFIFVCFIFIVFCFIELHRCSWLFKLYF